MGKFIDLTGQKFGRLTATEMCGSDNGGNAKWACSCDCGLAKVVHGENLRRGKTRSCGCLHSERSRERVLARGTKGGEEHPRWKGGRVVDNEGYVRVRNLDRQGGSVAQYEKEHRVVMSSHLGRPLLKSEQVHHKNGVRDDNRIENLELKVSPHGAKISVSDAVSWAKEILARYDSFEYPSEECIWH